MKHIMILLLVWCKTGMGQSEVPVLQDKSTISDLKNKSLRMDTNYTHILPEKVTAKTAVAAQYKIPSQKKFNVKDSSVKHSFSKSIKKLIPSGSVSAGYDYGFLPYTVNMSSPSSACKTEGTLALDLFNIPVDVTWFYSTQKNLIGLNNYFRISYNADRYKEKLNHKLNTNAETYKNQLGNLFSERQKVMQKMAYADYLSSVGPDRWPIDTTLAKPALPDINTPDSAQVQAALQQAGSYTQSAAYQKQRVDSVKQLYDKYNRQYEDLNDSIKKTQEKIKQLEELSSGNVNTYLHKTEHLNKAQNFISGIKKLEIGLCYPNHSAFLVSNVPVRGVNFEYGKKNRYLAFTYGTTISTLLYNSQNIEGFLQNVRNSYNYFDFNNLESGRKIVALKAGIGTKENNHVFVGFLLGKGQSTYLNFNGEDREQRNKESNLVIEADAKYKLAKNTTAELTLGKSSLKQEDLSYEFIKSAAREIFSPYRSYALLTKLSTKINATNTQLSFTYRWIDPFFKSFGTGFIRSDNMRYEMKLDQPLTKKLRYTGTFRYEEDNLLKLMNYKNVFYTVNNSVSLRIKRGLMLRAGYTPLFRTLTSDNYSYKNKNSITTGLISFIPKSRKANIQFNFVYNYYQVNTDTQQINFQNIAYYHQVSFKNRIKTGLSVSWFKNNLTDSLNNDIFLGVLDAGYEFKNGSSFVLAGKAAYKLNGELHPGFIAKVNLKLFKTLFWENQVEKFIVGDLFNGYDYENLKKFPYYCSTRLIYNF